MSEQNVIVCLQNQLDLQKQENINYINLINEQKLEIENLKNKIKFLEINEAKLTKETKLINDTKLTNDDKSSSLYDIIRNAFF